MARNYIRMPTSARLRQVIEDAIRGEIYRQLAATNGRVAPAAKNLGYHRSALYNLIKRLGMGKKAASPAPSSGAGAGSSGTG